MAPKRAADGTAKAADGRPQVFAGRRLVFWGPVSDIQKTRVAEMGGVVQAAVIPPGSGSGDRGGQQAPTTEVVCHNVTRKQAAAKLAALGYTG